MIELMKELFEQDKSVGLHDANMQFNEITNDEFIYYQEEALDKMAQAINYKPLTSTKVLN